MSEHGSRTEMFLLLVLGLHSVVNGRFVFKNTMQSAIDIQQTRSFLIIIFKILLTVPWMGPENGHAKHK